MWLLDGIGRLSFYLYQKIYHMERRLISGLLVALWESSWMANLFSLVILRLISYSWFKKCLDHFQTFFKKSSAVTQDTRASSFQRSLIPKPSKQDMRQLWTRLKSIWCKNFFRWTLTKELLLGKQSNTNSSTNLEPRTQSTIASPQALTASTNPLRSKERRRWSTLQKC